MFHFRSLARRFGVLFALGIAVVIGLCATVIFHLEGMRTDADRVLEETRESITAVRLRSSLESLRNAVAKKDRLLDAGDREYAEARVREALVVMDDLLGDQDDPSRDEHELTEAKLYQAMKDDILGLSERIASLQEGEVLDGALELVEHAHHYSEVLSAETERESSLAVHDLEDRARSARSVMIQTVFLASAGLGVVYLLVLFGVVRPIRALQQGAERIGRGDVAHRIHVRSRDEVGQLSDSFNEMASRVANTQKDLEDRVRKRTAEFLRAARLADMGLIASGVAHEINTPLASILSSAEGLERRVERGNAEESVIRDYLGTIQKEARRASEITTRMLALARQEPGKHEPVDLHVVVDQVEGILSSILQNRGIELVRSVIGDDLSVNITPGELVQVLVNLVKNAADSSARGARIELEIRVERDDFHLRVADGGHGIPPEDLDRVFDPFFTTKRPGQGTGLGLALVAVLVESHGGRIQVESEPGIGSTFRVQLPRDWSAAA